MGFSFPATVTAEEASAAELLAAGGGTERQRRPGIGGRWRGRRRSAVHVIAPVGRSERRLPAGAERGGGRGGIYSRVFLESKDRGGRGVLRGTGRCWWRWTRNVKDGERDGKEEDQE